MVLMMGSMKTFHLSSYATFKSPEISIPQLNVGIQLLDTIRNYLNRGGLLEDTVPSRPFVMFFFSLIP